jgi:hypothetical protein
MKPLSASEYDRRREFQIAAYSRLLSPPEKILASWRRSTPQQGVAVPAPVSRWPDKSWGKRWHWLRMTG